MAAGFFLIIYSKRAPLNSPMVFAGCQFMYDGVVKFNNLPIKLDRSAVFAQRSSRWFTSPRRALDVA
jgi:hypothetical protein